MSEKQSSSGGPGCLAVLTTILLVYTFWRGVIAASTYTTCQALLALVTTEADSALVRAAIDPTPATFVSGMCPK